MCLQDALAELGQKKKSWPQQLPATMSGLVPFASNTTKGSNVVHPAPRQQHTDWSSDHSSDEEEDQGPSEQLIAAAIYLLQDATLAGTDGVCDQEQQLEPPRNWDTFVQRQLADTFTAAPSSKLLAMHNAVPSASARMVYASQVRLSGVLQGRCGLLRCTM